MRRKERKKERMRETERMSKRERGINEKETGRGECHG